MFTDTLQNKNKFHSLNVKNQLIDLSGYSLSELIDYISLNSINQINFYWLGRFDYYDAWDLQRKIQKEIIN